VGLATELGRRGHDVSLFARTAPFGLDRFGPGVRFVGMNGHSPATSRLEVDWTPPEREHLLEQILSMTKRAPLDVLHFHYAIPFAGVVEEAGRRMGARSPSLVGTLHGTDVTTHGRRNGLAKHLASLDAVTTVSRRFAAISARTLGLGTGPLVIPNFVDLTRFRPLSNGSDHRRRIVHVSNFRPVKDPELVIDVFTRVRREIDAELWLVGDGEGMRSVHEAALAAGVDGDVRTFGLRRDVERILPRTDVLLVTSRSESFCLAAMEAAACGIPAVASRVGGLPEVVRHGETGILYPAGDAAAASRAVVDLLRAPLRRKALGDAARSRAAAFSTPTIVSRYEQLYLDLVRGLDSPRVNEAVG
jgi:L-malate glycosyltransferase